MDRYQDYVRAVRELGLQPLRIDEFESLTGAMSMSEIINLTAKKSGTDREELSEGTKMASAPDPMDERNSMMEMLSERYYGKPLKDLTEDEIIDLEEAFDDLTTEKPKQAPSITLADGGRAAFKDGLLAKLNKPFKIDSGTLRSMFFNKNNPIITGFNTSELFDIVTNLSSSIPFADGGRAAYKMDLLIQLKESL